jgi:hypothetical protein
MVEPVDPMEGGLSVGAWIALWQASHAVTSMGAWRVSWPDGGSTLVQPALTIAMFELIAVTLREATEKNG